MTKKIAKITNKTVKIACKTVKSIYEGWIPFLYLALKGSKK